MQNHRAENRFGAVVLSCVGEGPEVEILHWYYKEGDEKLNSSRYLELWLPVVKK